MEDHSVIHSSHPLLMIHQGINNLLGFEQFVAESLPNESLFFQNGYLLIKKDVNPALCELLCNDLSGNKFNMYPFRSSSLEFMRGITRSPFITSKPFRDLLLHQSRNRICQAIFPSGYQLHLNRAVTSSRIKPSFSTQIHRDIPHIHTPSRFPISLSFLSFLSPCVEPQLRLWPMTHDKSFYSFKSVVPLDLSFDPGDTLVFDSNIIHCTLATSSTVHYVLNMFTTPIIKPVVEYTSPHVLKMILGLGYRNDEIIALLGHKYLSSIDDSQYLDTH